MPNHLLARFDGEPCLVAPHAGTGFAAALDAVLTGPYARDMMADGAASSSGDDGFWGEPGTYKAALRPYIVTSGVLQIPVKGVLLNGFSFAYGSFATGYPYIARAFDRGLADPDVKGIAFLIDSGGGAVAENFDLVDRIFAARGTKPIRAFAHERAYSAAYSIASAADRIVVARTGGVGSIGVVTGHLDVSVAMDKAGVKMTFIFAGEGKTDGNSYEPLSDDAEARIQARVDALYGVFVTTVARNRGMSEAAVRAVKAHTYMPDEAVANGLADSIGSLDDAVTAFVADLNPPEQDDNDMITPEAHEAALAAARTDTAATATTAATAAANARVTAILADDRSKGRERAALRLAATSPAMSAEEVLAFVAENVALPVAPGAPSRLDALVPDPAVGPDAGANEVKPGANLAAAVDKMVAGMTAAR